MTLDYPFKNAHSFYKKSPNLNNKLQSELLIILFIQEMPLFHFLPKNGLGATSLFPLIIRGQEGICVCDAGLCSKTPG